MEITQIQCVGKMWGYYMSKQAVHILTVVLLRAPEDQFKYQLNMSKRTYSAHRAPRQTPQRSLMISRDTTNETKAGGRNSGHSCSVIFLTAPRQIAKTVTQNHTNHGTIRDYSLSLSTAPLHINGQLGAGWSLQN